MPAATGSTRRERAEALFRRRRWTQTAMTWLRKATATVTYRDPAADADEDWSRGQDAAALLRAVMDYAERIARPGVLSNDFADSWEFDVILRDALAVVAALQAMPDAAKLAAKIELLSRVEGREPAEAKEFLRKAGELRERLAALERNGA